MSVLIKGMQIPKNCSDCPLNYDMMSCMITGTRWWSDTMVLMDFDCQESRLYDCPLVEIPETHGRLIDADAFAECIKSIIERQRYDDVTIEKFLTVGAVLNAVIDELKGTALYGYENAPTVIEAE